MHLLLLFSFTFALLKLQITKDGAVSLANQPDVVNDGIIQVALHISPDVANPIDTNQHNLEIYTSDKQFVFANYDAYFPSVNILSVAVPPEIVGGKEYVVCVTKLRTLSNAEVSYCTSTFKVPRNMLFPRVPKDSFDGSKHQNIYLVNNRFGFPAVKLIKNDNGVPQTSPLKKWLPLDFNYYMIGTNENGGSVTSMFGITDNENLEFSNVPFSVGQNEEFIHVINISPDFLAAVDLNSKELIELSEGTILKKSTYVLLVRHSSKKLSITPAVSLTSDKKVSLRDSFQDTVPDFRLKVNRPHKCEINPRQKGCPPPRKNRPMPAKVTTLEPKPSVSQTSSPNHKDRCKLNPHGKGCMHINKKNNSKTIGNLIKACKINPGLKECIKSTSTVSSSYSSSETSTSTIASQSTSAIISSVYSSETIISKSSFSEIPTSTIVATSSAYSSETIVSKPLESSYSEVSTSQKIDTVTPVESSASQTKSYVSENSIAQETVSEIKVFASANSSVELDKNYTVNLNMNGTNYSRMAFKKIPMPTNETIGQLLFSNISRAAANGSQIIANATNTTGPTVSGPSVIVESSAQIIKSCFLFVIFVIFQ